MDRAISKLPFELGIGPICSWQASQSENKWAFWPWLNPLNSHMNTEWWSKLPWPHTGNNNVQCKDRKSTSSLYTILMDINSSNGNAEELWTALRTWYMWVVRFVAVPVALVPNWNTCGCIVSVERSVIWRLPNSASTWHCEPAIKFQYGNTIKCLSVYASLPDHYGSC